MFVRFHLEHRAQAVADIHHSGIFSRTLHHMLALRWQPPQVDAARFVGAVLAPHHAENSQFGNVGIAAQDFLDACVFFRGQPVVRGYFRGDLRGLSDAHQSLSCNPGRLSWTALRSYPTALAGISLAGYALAVECCIRLCTIELRITRPSTDPSPASMARSGCGIMPSTLRSRLQIPAIPAIDPFGLASG